MSNEPPLNPRLSSERQASRESRAFVAGGALIILVAGYFVIRNFWMNQPLDESETRATSSASEESTGASLIEQKVLQIKIQNKEPLDLIDIRDKAAYDLEHIPGSLSVPPASFQNFAPSAGRPLIIISSAADPETDTIIRNLLAQKSAIYSFLDGGFEGWKAAGYPTISQGDPNSFVDQSKVTYITPAELKAKLQMGENIALLDVQNEASFRQVHLAGALNIPLSDLEKRKNEIPLAQEIIVYGENELASFQGGVRLADLNYFSVRTLSGNDHLSASSSLFREP